MSLWVNPNPNILEDHQTSSKPSAVEAFHRKLPGYQPTQLIPLPDLARELGVKHIFLKDESNRLGLPAFKIMGASWGVFQAVRAELDLMPPDDGQKEDEVDLQSVKVALCTHPVILYTATDGNHGRAVAYMAKLLGIKAVIYIPSDMDEHTRQLLAEEGATVVISGDYDEAVIEAANAARQQSGGILVQDTGFEGYETIPMWIIEGYSTIFNEVDAELAMSGLSVDVIVVPVGVGSLAHSVVRHYRTSRLDAIVVAVEPEAASCLHTSLRAGQPTPIQTSFTIMAGMNCGTVSSTAWRDLRSSVHVSVTISDTASHQAVQYLANNGISTGPCGASGLAALRQLTATAHEVVGLTENSVILLLNTEGSRPYQTATQLSI